MARKNLTLRLDEETYKLYKVLLIETGGNVQDDLENYVKGRLQEAGKLPASNDGQEPKGG